jgi:hypothetical protein
MQPRKVGNYRNRLFNQRSTPLSMWGVPLVRFIITIKNTIINAKIRIPAAKSLDKDLNIFVNSHKISSAPMKTTIYHNSVVMG